MLIVRPDFARQIEIPGAGPCLRPVDIDRSHAGCSDLVSLRVYAFTAGQVINGEAEHDEVFIVAMRGAADIAISQDGRPVGEFALQSACGPRVAYMPPWSSYRLAAIGDCDIAYARAEPSLVEIPEVRGFAAADSRIDITGHATGMNLALVIVQPSEEAAPAYDAAVPERFVHIRSDDHMAATIGGEPIGDWDSAVLGHGERASVLVKTGRADILTVSTSRYSIAVPKRAPTKS